MKKFIIPAALAALALPNVAFAGFGATANLTGLSDGTSWAPSLDWREKGFHVQVQALDTIGGLTNDQLNLGAGFTVIAAKRKMAEEVEGTVMPGARVRYFGFTGDTGDAMEKSKLQASGFNLIGEVRMGMEMKQGMGFGVYVVPQLGISNLGSLGGLEDDSELGLAWGGGLEVSCWMMK